MSQEKLVGANLTFKQRLARVNLANAAWNGVFVGAFMWGLSANISYAVWREPVSFGLG